MRKRVLTVTVLILISLVTVSAVGARALYVTKPVPSKDRHSISEIVYPQSLWEKVVTGSGFMEGINFDRNGEIWMVSPATGEIMKVEGSKVSIVGEKYKVPVGAKFHKDGRLFIADGTGELYAYNTTTGQRTTIVNSYNGSSLKGLNDLVFDNAGGLYFTEPTGSSATKPTGRVFYLPPDGSGLQLFQENIAYPNGIAISADGQRVYISEFGTNRIISVPSKNAKDQREVAFVFGQFEGGIGPDGLAVDTEGNLYVAHFQAGEIVVLDPSGFKYGTIRLPEGAGTFSTNLTFHDGYLYVTESSKNEVWRIKVKKNGLEPYGLQ
ncbi:SMP-30/gluconolactonase/LRE family protein [Bacillus sp. ISL-75]|uniref:SMP-30/gluconolactonase/LRE family protein n=1 Tax=Bacillus sp. ISL-75 TaxID=2819137 RepID=UPI001BE8D122|nr:SMP-30/gluconolactonase/LRE family protein [Bacillus sp. ISL-75]MBT2726810.1 SMP-30/gluconolactonase/LRE family protein [Bacillus sp. ISL-75]